MGERAPDPDLAGALQEAERALRELGDALEESGIAFSPGHGQNVANKFTAVLTALAAAAAPSEGVNEPDGLRGANLDASHTASLRDGHPSGSLTPGAAPSGERDAGPQPPETT